jgi:hypothetical protein
VICAELPCDFGGELWNLDDEQLGQLLKKDLDAAGIPVTSQVEQVLVKRLTHAYPVYELGFEDYFNRIDAWASNLQSVLTFGRQGLFAHDNTHHALFMAYSAVKCTSDDGTFDEKLWQEYRKVFDTHVVVD